MKERIIYRDFIYLDWDRVRSIAAQILEGIPGEKQISSGHEDTKNTEIGGNLAFFKGSTGHDIRYFHSEGETRSLHHFVYSLIEEKLSEDKFIHVFSISFIFVYIIQVYFIYLDIVRQVC